MCKCAYCKILTARFLDVGSEVLANFIMLLDGFVDLDRIFLPNRLDDHVVHVHVVHVSIDHGRHENIGDD